MRKKPNIAPLPAGTGERLIDNGLPLETSDNGFAERYGKGKTSHTIHVWWARRPHAAMRALVFATLCRENGKNAKQLLKKMSRSESIGEVRNILSAQYGRRPKLLDMFGGGGTIPLEAMNLGAEAHAADSNQLSVFLQKCNMIYTQKERRIAEPLLMTSGKRILDRLAIETEPLFPYRNREGQRSVFGYLWTYSTVCGNCGYRYFLMKRPWLSKKKGKHAAFTVSNGKTEQKLSFGLGEDCRFAGVWDRGRTICPDCGHAVEKIDIRACRDELAALIGPADGRGKEFLPASEDAVPDESIIRKMEADALAAIEGGLPSSELPVWSGIVNPALRGMEKHADFLNPRQRAVLALLIRCLHDEYFHLSMEESENTAKCVIGLLSGLIDQSVDWNCRLSMWIPRNEQTGRAFCGPGVAMLWDYAETDPVSSGPGNLWNKLDRIVRGTKSIESLPGRGHVRRAYAQELPFDDGHFDAIVTDPPYYDNIFYSALADFFYSWKRILFKQIEPELFESESTDNSRELVVTKYRGGSTVKTHENYIAQLRMALGEASRVLKKAGVFALIYSHGSMNGWDALVRAYRPSNLVITSVQPLCIERRQRPRAMRSRAVNTCVAFVARKFDGIKRAVTPDRLLERFRKACYPAFATELTDAGWNGNDAAMALFALGVGMMANSGRIDGCSDIEAMTALEKAVKEWFPDFRIARRRSL